MNNFEPPPIEGQTSSPANAYVEVLNQQIAGGFTKTLSSRSLLEVRVGVNRTEAGKSASAPANPNMLEAYGITGLPTDAVFSGGLTEQGVGGWTTWGRQNSNPQYQNPFVDRHAHQLLVDSRPALAEDRLRIPAHQHRSRRRESEVRAGHLRRPVQPAGGRRGRHRDLQPRRLPDGRAQRLRAGQPVHHPAAPADALRLHPGRLARIVALTLNLGLRYEFATPQWDANNKLTNFDPATRTLLQAKDGSIYDRALVNPDKNNFGPRLGMAYSINDKTVLRSAYGIGYVLFNRLGGENLLPFNGPHVVPIVDHAAAVAGPVHGDPGADHLLPHRRRWAIRKA